MDGTRVHPSGDFCVVFICGRYKFRFTAGISSGYKCPTVREPRLERFVFVLTGPSLSRRAGDSWVGSFPRLCLCGIESAGPGFPGPAFLLLSCSAGCGCVLMVCAIVVFLSDLLREGQKRIARCFSVGCAPPYRIVFTVSDMIFLYKKLNISPSGINRSSAGVAGLWRFLMASFIFSIS